MPTSKPSIPNPERVVDSTNTVISDGFGRFSENDLTSLVAERMFGGNAKLTKFKNLAAQGDPDAIKLLAALGSVGSPAPAQTHAPGVSGSNGFDGKQAQANFKANHPDVPLSSKTGAVAQGAAIGTPETAVSVGYNPFSSGLLRDANGNPVAGNMFDTKGNAIAGYVAGGSAAPNQSKGGTASSGAKSTSNGVGTPTPLPGGGRKSGGAGGGGSTTYAKDDGRRIGTKAGGTPTATFKSSAQGLDGEVMTSDQRNAQDNLSKAKENLNNLGARPSRGKSAQAAWDTNQASAQAAVDRASNAAQSGKMPSSDAMKAQSMKEAAARMKKGFDAVAQKKAEMEAKKQADAEAHLGANPDGSPYIDPNNPTLKPPGGNPGNPGVTDSDNGGDGTGGGTAGNFKRVWMGDSIGVRTRAN